MAAARSKRRLLLALGSIWIVVVISATIFIRIEGAASGPGKIPFSTYAAAVMIFSGIVIAALGIWRLLLTLTQTRYEILAEKESERLRRSVGLAPSRGGDVEDRIDRLEEQFRQTITNDGRRDVRKLRDELTVLRVRLDEREAQADPADKNLEILVEIYGQAISQMKTSFLLSQAFAAIGALILLTGVALAIFRASTNGQQIAAILTTVVGFVTNLTAGLFFVQSNRARKHLERQADQLRSDVRLGEITTQAEAVVEKVEDSARRDELREKIVRRIINSANGDLASFDSE
jgi:hypothetical protein